MTSIVTADFRGDTLFGFEEGDQTYVGLKPIVEAMGMDWSAQYRRVQRDPILSEGIAMMATPFGRGGDQEAVCLKRDPCCHLTSCSRPSMLSKDHLE